MHLKCYIFGWRFVEKLEHMFPHILHKNGVSPNYIGTIHDPLLAIKFFSYLIIVIIYSMICIDLP